MVCRRRGDQGDLQRAGRSADGVWYLGSGPGRGLWWCRDEGCGSGPSPAQASRALRCVVDEKDVAVLRELARRSKTVVVVEE